MKLFPYLKLIRFPNLPTVVVDVLAGYFVASRLGVSALGENIGSSATPVWEPLLMLVIAAMLLYAGGMANNDLQHAEKDWVLKKPRPIPQDQVSFGAATAISFVGLFGGVLLASMAIGRLGVIAFFVAGCAYAYNWLAKGRRVDASYIPPKRWQNVLGAVLMALCRVGSVGLGLALGAVVRSAGTLDAGVLSDPLIWIFAGSTLLYFLCVMSASLLEDFGGGVSALKKLRWAVLLATWAGPLGFAWLAFGQGGWNETLDSTVWLMALPAAMVLIMLTVLTQWRFSIAIADPQPRNVGMIVKWSILGHVWLEAALVFLSSPDLLVPGIVLAAVFSVCAGLGRLSYST